MPKINEVQYRYLSFERAMVNSESRTIELSFASEAPVQRYDWWSDSYYNEILGFEPGNVDLTRLSQMGVLLFNHKSDVPIGEVTDPQCDSTSRKATCKVRFDTDQDSEKIYQKVLSGTLKGVSVGYRVTVWEEVKAGAASTCGRFQGPCDIARKWEPYEVSIVSIPADTTVGVGRAQEIPQIKEMLKPIIDEMIKERMTSVVIQPKPDDGSKQSDLDSYRRKLSIREKSIV